MDGWTLPIDVPSVSACVCEWVNPSDGRGRHSACQPPCHQCLMWSTLSGQKTRKAVHKRGPFAICNLSCLLSSVSCCNVNLLFFMLDVDRRASHGLPPPHMTMPLDCQLPPESHWCGTLDRTAAAGHLAVLLLGSSREVLGGKKTETSTHSSSRFAWASVQQVASMLAGKTLDVFSHFFGVLLSAF